MTRDDAWPARAGRVLETTGRVVAVLASWLLTAAKVVAVGLTLAAAYVANADRRARARRWFLLKGDRWRLVHGFVLVVFVVTFALALLDYVGVREPSFVATMFSSVIGGLFSFVPIVVTVNQLAVSQVFGSPEDLRAEIDSVDGLRSTIERMHPEATTASTEPAAFLRMAFEVLEDRADALEAAVPEEETMTRMSTEVYLDVVRAQVRDVEEALDDRNHPLIDVLVPMMGDSYSRALNDTRRLRASFVDLSPTAVAVLDDFETLYVELDVLRQYFKSLYIQQELSYLSRQVGYTGILGFLVAAGLVMGFGNGQPLPNHPLALDFLISIAMAIVALPFAVLVSFVLRVATIAQRTAASGTFTPTRETAQHAHHR